MSLSRFLDKPVIRARFWEEFPLPPIPSKSEWELLAPPLSLRPQVIGGAFDYLLRFRIMRHLRVIESEMWVAEAATHRLGGKQKAVALRMCRRARELLRDYLKTGVLNDELFARSFQLACLDEIARSGEVFIKDDWKITEADLEDLKSLWRVCHPAIVEGAQTAILNPTFGVGSGLVGGADADFRLDETLWELKTTRTPRQIRSHTTQLLGYSLLNFLNGGAAISEVAIYYARFGKIVRFPAPDWNNHLDFAAWFCWEAGQTFGTNVLFEHLKPLELKYKLRALCAMAERSGNDF